MKFPSSAPKSGFSLIEVVIALGVLSFAIIPIVGLIGTSLQTYRGSIHETVSRQIMTQLAANAQQARLDDLVANPTATFYFDYEGLPVTSGDPDRIYTATVTNLPDSSLLNTTNLFLVQITVVPLDTNAVQKTSLRVLPQN